MTTRAEIENLAVSFRMNSPNLGHCDVWNAMSDIGGGVAILYGLFLATPKRCRHKRQRIAMSIAAALADRAFHLKQGVK